MNKLKSLAFVALAAFGLSAHARQDDTVRWEVDFESPTSNGVSFVQGELGNLTNSVAYSGAAGVQPYDSGVWYALDGDESYVTNGIVTNVVAGVNVETNSTYLKLDTQGNDLRWAPTNTTLEIINLVDADLYLVGSDSAPDASDFDGNHDVQTAIFLKNEIDDGTGDTTNSVLCVYVYNSGTEANGWQELEGEGVKIDDNSWHHVQVSIDYRGESPIVSVVVDDHPMHTRGAADTDANRQWTVANTTTAKSANQVQSVSFRGTGAVDNFVGTSRQEAFDTLTFAAEVYMNGVKQAIGTTGNTTRYKPAEAGDPGSGMTVKFENFLLSDYDYENYETNATWAVEKIEFINPIDGSISSTTYFTWDVASQTAETNTYDGNIFIATDEEFGYQTGSFNVTTSTDGAVDPTNLVLQIYFKTVGASNALDVVDMAGVVTTNAQLVLPSSFENGGTTNFTWTFDAVSGGNLLSTIRVANGASLVSFENGVATVSVTLDEALSDHTLFVTATYAPGTLAEGQEIRYTEAGGVYTFTPYTPPVAIIVAGNVTNEYPSLRAAIDVALPGSTIYLVADDKVSFTAEDPEVVINKALTIDGGSNTLYGVTDYAYDGVNDHDIYIGGSGNVTIKNLTLSEFSDTVPTAQRRTNPIWVGKGYTGTLMLDGVTVTNFNRTAFNLGGGTVVVTNCVVGGCYDPEMEGDDCFQSAIEVFDANVTVAETKVTGVGSTMTKEDSQIASCFTLISDIASDPWTGGTGSIRILSGSYAGEYIGLAMDRSEGSILVEGGTFVAAAPAADEAFGLDGEDPASSITITGGWFDRPPTNYLADGFTAVNYGTDAPDRSAPWTVVLGNAIWIGGAQGDWEDAANWDVGLVPTKDTVATFTNNAEVAILTDKDDCKEIVLGGVEVTLVPSNAQASDTHLLFWGNNGSAVSGTGTLVVDGVGLFNGNTSDVLTIGTDLRIAGTSSFRGNHKNGTSVAGSFTVTGATTLSASATVSAYDYQTATFQGPVTVSSNVTSRIYAHHDGTVVFAAGSTVTLLASPDAPATTLELERGGGGTITVNDSQIVTDDADYYVKRTVSGSVTSYQALPKRTVISVAADEGLTVEGIATGDRFVPGTNFVIAVTGFGEGYEPSVMITNGTSVLLTTNAVNFQYAAPDSDIGVVVAKVVKTFDITFKPGNGDDDIVTNVEYNATAYIPADPTLAGFTFLGWTNALDATDATAYTNNPMPAVTSNATYAAKWEETPSGHIGAKSDEGFVILAPADGDYDDTKPLTFAAPNITAGTVEISASMVGPDSGTTAQLTLLYKTDLTAANYSTVEVTVKDIDATAGTATVELPANFMDGKNTLFFFGFSNEPGVLDDPQP